MSGTEQQDGAAENTSMKCAWCGKHSTSRCSQCHHVRVCSQACMKKLYRIHNRVCVRLMRKSYITSPESSLYGVGELDFEVAHRQLKGDYSLDEETGRPVMREPYESEEDRPDYLLVLPPEALKGATRSKVQIRYMDTIQLFMVLYSPSSRLTPSQYKLSK